MSQSSSESRQLLPVKEKHCGIIKILSITCPSTYTSSYFTDEKTRSKVINKEASSRTQVFCLHFIAWPILCHSIRGSGSGN
jgi:hypothetical protein